MRTIAHVLTVLAIVALVAGRSLAQASPQSFEVVSIKPRVGPAPLGGGGNAPDRFERPDTELILLIRYAHDLFDFQVVGGPDWIRSKRWEISAKAPGPVGGAAAMRPLVKRMLEDRFALEAALQRRVIDKTGLMGNYDIELTYVDENLLARSASLGGGAPSDGPSLFTALQEQLGMKLESARGPVEVLVVDSVSEPATN